MSWRSDVAPTLNEGDVRLRPLKASDARAWQEGDDIIRGLQTFSTFANGRHFKDFLYENEDAMTGDCFLQCCVFNEVIYG